MSSCHLRLRAKTASHAREEGDGRDYFGALQQKSSGRFLWPVHWQFWLLVQSCRIGMFKVHCVFIAQEFLRISRKRVYTGPMYWKKSAQYHSPDRSPRRAVLATSEVPAQVCSSFSHLRLIAEVLHHCIT